MYEPKKLFPFSISGQGRLRSCAKVVALIALGMILSDLTLSTKVAWAITKEEAFSIATWAGLGKATFTTAAGFGVYWLLIGRK